MRRSANIASLFLGLFFIFSEPELVAALSKVTVTVPTAIKHGENALLICNYDMQNDTLYTVKWYRGRREFYRYTPKENPARKTFQSTSTLFGINVEPSLSNATQVYLYDVPSKVSGRFSCEVSADAPTFHTATDGADMEVVDVPTQRPVITGIHSRYRLGDIINGNCSSDYSKPAANLTWLVNDFPANGNYIRFSEVTKHRKQFLETSTVEINFIVGPQHFEKGRLKLKCTAKIFDLYFQETEKIIEEDRPRILASGRSPEMNMFPFDPPSDEEKNEQYSSQFDNKSGGAQVNSYKGIMLIMTSLTAYMVNFLFSFHPTSLTGLMTPNLLI